MTPAGSRRTGEAGEESRLEVHLVPRASGDEIRGWDDAGRLKVRVSAPALEGRANRALVKLLARALGVPGREVRLVRGESSRTKTIAVRGVSAGELARVLGRPSQT